ncbi:ABC transporter ATP-binding protein [Salicibibacter cibarius]|uniref:ABC transporter ATP-binding protein n=1 Tax=Salicibibacter cibarius TaxID=2743000 RepID=A0A7T6Z532_9BACI|nr:ABC transporter ATP-binding protein [Salicibibacter cibarius]QQK76972.1 ABC transporter ATP-binding protein [Salicibibacter cibarius]
MQTVIKSSRISKNYKGFQAVKDVSLNICKGEIYGFIGLNGSGKTTTIRMLLGMIKPTEGACYIKGEKVTSTNHRIWRSVGHIVETPHCYPELTVLENLEIFRRIRLMSDPEIVPRVMEQLHLTRYAQKKARNLSLGNTQRLGIAKALLHSPEILILDEPMNGLDPSGIVEIRTLLQDLALNKGVTILMSSHLLREVAKIATKIGIIHKGRLIQEIESMQLSERLNQQLVIDTRNNASAISQLTTAGYASKINNDGLIETTDGRAIRNPDEISRLLVYTGFAPTTLTVKEENLESYFLKITEREGEKLQ